MITHNQVHLAQVQRGFGTQLVRPVDAAIANDKFALGKYPISHRAVLIAALGEIQTRHHNLALCIAPDNQLRAVNVNLLKPQTQHRLR